MKKSLVSMSALSLAFVLAACGEVEGEPLEENERVEIETEPIDE